MLHSFYSGIENIFKRIALEYDGELSKGDAWHRDLLMQMTLETPKREGIINEELRKELRGYLDFRHVFRNAYTFQLQWEKMEDLVLEARAVKERFDDALRPFIARLQRDK
jgi:hypothetical protein